MYLFWRVCFRTGGVSVSVSVSEGGLTRRCTRGGGYDVICFCKVWGHLVSLASVVSVHRWTGRVCVRRKLSGNDRCDMLYFGVCVHLNGPHIHIHTHTLTGTTHTGVAKPGVTVLMQAFCSWSSPPNATCTHKSLPRGAIVLLQIRPGEPWNIPYVFRTLE